MGRAFGNNGKLTKPLKPLVNENGIFEYDTQLATHDVPPVVKTFLHKTWRINHGEYLILQKILKGKWVVMCGIEVFTLYVINEVPLSTKNH